MKVTIATGLYPPEIGGPATYAAMLESELQSRGFTIETVPFGEVRHHPKGIRHVFYMWKVWRQSKDADVIYALDPVSVGLPALLVARLRRKPFLVRLGGDYAWEQGRTRFGIKDSLDDFHANKKTWPLQVRLFARLQLYVVRNAQKVIVPSKYLKKIVTQWGVPAEHIQVIYSALYPLTVSGGKEELRRQLAYSTPTIVSAARLVPWKGFRMLIEVVAHLQKTYPHISLVIIGDGEQREALEALVAKHHLSEQVRFTGRISKEALGAAIKAADVFVLNTAYEGLSHQLIEVMDIGTPIVTTNAGGNPELITNGVNGFLVEFNNKEQLTEAITRVFNHPKSGERMVQAARGRSKDFLQSAVVNDVEALLRTIHEKKHTA